MLTRSEGGRVVVVVIQNKGDMATRSDGGRGWWW